LLKVDERNGNIFWKNALAKEMTEVGVAFKVLNKGAGAVKNVEEYLSKVKGGSCHQRQRAY
jgi:hypothetical protein